MASFFTKTVQGVAFAIAAVRLRYTATHVQAHSLLWHYLWVAPNVLLLALAVATWRRGLNKRFPAFQAFAVLAALAELAFYFADVAPFVSAYNFWRVDWACLFLEAILKFALVAEIFANVSGSYSSIARLGKTLFRAGGVALVLIAATVAAFAPGDNPSALVSGAHILEQTIFLIESGALVFIFLFSLYFGLSWNKQLFGIALGLSVSSCVHLATWGIVANAGLSNPIRYDLDFINMATYHLCVLIWAYYLLVPAKTAKDLPSPASLPENNLKIWNEELEHLLQR